MSRQPASVTFAQRVRAAVGAFLAGRVGPVDVGANKDGLTPMYGGGGYATAGLVLGILDLVAFVILLMIRMGNTQ